MKAKYRQVDLRRTPLRSLGQNVAAGVVKSRPAPEGAVGPDGEFTKEFLDQMEKEARDTVENNPRVYHYCGFDAFVGIVKNRELWATNTFYLNDREETIHAINMYLDAVDYIQASDKDKANIYRFLYRFLSQRAPANIFVCCFSQQGTQLSQWRAYAPKGGISVGFHVDKLAKLADDKTVFFRPVLYHPVEQLRLVLPEVSKLIGRLPDYLPKNEPDAFAILDQEIYPQFQITSAFLKHWAFLEEQEVRLAIIGGDKDVSYRTRGNSLIPYIKLNIEELRSDNALFDELILGPSKENFHDRLFSIVEFLASEGLECERCHESGIPYQD